MYFKHRMKKEVLINYIREKKGGLVITNICILHSAGPSSSLYQDWLFFKVPVIFLSPSKQSLQ
jgi:hypothetical protein